MARIDDSHQPFKRTRKLGPGPKRHKPVTQKKDWECHRGSKPYEQICVWVGDGKRKPTKNVMNKAKKKAYNKLYRKWAAKNRKALQSRGRIGSYRCHKTKQTACK